MSNHIIDERCGYLEFVFGYDDTERIVVQFELGNAGWTTERAITEPAQPWRRRSKMLSEC